MTEGRLSEAHCPSARRTQKEKRGGQPSKIKQSVPSCPWFWPKLKEREVRVCIQGGERAEEETKEVIWMV